MENLAEVLVSFDSENTQSYSCRGNKCVAIVCETPRQTVAEIAKHIVESVQDQTLVLELLEELTDSAEDSMGLEQILYFPNVDAELLPYEEDLDKTQGEYEETNLSELSFEEMTG